MQFKERVITQNNYLFPPKDEEFDDTFQQNGVFKITSEENFAVEFGWLPLLHTYAKENSISINQVTESSALEFLYFMNYFTRKCQLDAEMIERGNRQNKL